MVTQTNSTQSQQSGCEPGRDEIDLLLKVEDDKGEGVFVGWGQLSNGLQGRG